MLTSPKAFIKKNGLYLALSLPLGIYIFGFTLGPVLCTIFMSFQDKFTRAFPTLGNYAYILTHFQFRQAFANTLAVTFLSLALELTLGMLLAVLLTKRFAGKGIMRALALLPLGVPTIVAASNMRYIFDSQGYLNEILYRLHIIATPIDWTGGGLKTIFCVAVSDVWKVTPLVMLILLAGLENIPTQVYEAARVDGASPWKIFRSITLPLLKPFITIAVIVRGIDAFRLFELPLILAGSGTPFISTYTYFEYFQYGNPYSSAASAVILLLMIVISAVVYLRSPAGRGSLYG